MAGGGRRRHEGPTTIERVAAWLAAIHTSDIPARHLEQAKLLLLDTIGCGLAGWHEHVARDTVAVIESMGGAPQCQVLGRPLRTSLPNAVLANGTLVRVLDLNDYLIGIGAEGDDMGGHPSDNIPVALAAGELYRAPGREVLAAIVVGYELYGRLRALMERQSDWDGVTASGPVAAAIVGRLAGLDATRLAHAMALALARSATPGAVRSGDISAAKSIANALIAQTGAQAALLAGAGITGPIAVIEQRRGLASVLPKHAAVDGLLAPFGARALIMGSHVKAYPCVATAQSIVAAALALHREIKGDWRSIESLRLVLADYPTVLRHQSDPGRIDPRSREAADHSFPFLAAVSIIDGAFGLVQLEGERWHDPAVRRLMSVIAHANDPAWARLAPGSYPCRIEARCAGARSEVATECRYPPGFSHDGIEAADVIAKLERVSAGVLDAAGRRRVIDAAMELDKARDCTALVAALAAGGAG